MASSVVNRRNLLECTRIVCSATNPQPEQIAAMIGNLQHVLRDLTGDQTLRVDVREAAETSDPLLDSFTQLYERQRILARTFMVEHLDGVVRERPLDHIDLTQLVKNLCLTEMLRESTNETDD